MTERGDKGELRFDEGQYCTVPEEPLVCFLHPAPLQRIVIGQLSPRHAPGRPARKVERDFNGIAMSYSSVMTYVCVPSEGISEYLQENAATRNT